jgi:hypothetical protein
MCILLKYKSLRDTYLFGRRILFFIRKESNFFPQQFEFRLESFLIDLFANRTYYYETFLEFQTVV